LQRPLQVHPASTNLAGVDHREHEQVVLRARSQPVHLSRLALVMQLGAALLRIRTKRVA